MSECDCHSCRRERNGPNELRRQLREAFDDADSDALDQLIGDIDE